MGKKAKARREAAGAVKPVEVRPPLRSGPNRPLLVLSGFGILLAGYLAWTWMQGEALKGCSVGSSCDIVLSSKWATFLGLPTAFWGLMAYISLAATAFVKRVDRHWQYAWGISLFGLAYSAYLTTVSVTILGAACPYCLTSLATMTAIFGVVTYQRPAEIADFSWTKWLAKTVPVAAVAILLMHLNYVGILGEPPKPEDPMARSLAVYLSDSGAKMYGAYWCPHCQEQKEMFGAAAWRLPYVECSPDGQGRPQAPVCHSLNILSYPTWIINGQRYEEVMNLQRLADLSGFKAPPAAAN